MSDNTEFAPPDGPPLPEMREAILTPDDLAALINDLQQCTQILAILRKDAARSHADAAGVALPTAVDDLLNGTIRAVQIRYAYDGHEWTDSLLQTPLGIRLVRCQHTPIE